MPINREPGSFRDPSGFVFTLQGTTYRAVTLGYRHHYEQLMSSGLYQRLVSDGLLIEHQEVSLPSVQFENLDRILKPYQLSFISYPYEWCFAQLKDAAVAYLEIQRIALEHDMTVKDASCFNMQFVRGQPCLIDTLSFQRFEPGQPWTAYRQFCEHFLAPLALASMVNPQWIQFLRVCINGIPLNLATKSLPLRSWLRFGLLLHIHFQSLSTGLTKNRSGHSPKPDRPFKKESFYGLILSLKKTIESLRKPSQKEGWNDYYQSMTDTGYVDAKKDLVTSFLHEVDARYVWDIGANDGFFSRLAVRPDGQVISLDSDHACVSRNYAASRSNGNKGNIIPLVVDISNPSPNLGWGNIERSSLLDRGPAELVLALALVHHLAIGNNVPLNDIAAFFARICANLIIEFVPKSDRRVQELLAHRVDIFDTYDQANFERAFMTHFTIVRKSEILHSGRTIFLMQKK